MTDKDNYPVDMTLNSHTELLGKQSWPTACLYVVATPIGNLADLSPRAAEALRRCDAIAAEDTRNSRKLLQAWGINTPLLAAHRHNEHAAAESIIKKIQLGQTIALVSDAGAPAVSDPGSYIVNQASLAGIRVIPIPGPSAVITALMASGATSDTQPGFAFAGFAPNKTQARRSWLGQWLAYDFTVVIYEAPHRLADTLADITALAVGTRQITVARELTKRFEQIVTMPVSELLHWLNTDARHQQGEFVLILHPVPKQEHTGTALSQETQDIMRILLDELSTKDAVRIGVKLTGAKRDVLYDWALNFKSAQD